MSVGATGGDDKLEEEGEEDGGGGGGGCKLEATTSFREED